MTATEKPSRLILPEDHDEVVPTVGYLKKMEKRINERFDGLEQRLGGVEQRLDSIEDLLENIDKKV